MRLGGPVFIKENSQEEWAGALINEGYRAAVFPLGHDADETLIKTYVEEAAKNDIVIAEVGAWSNPISTDMDARKTALEHCQKQLDLAERIGANCCVNIAGSRGEQWDGPHEDNFTEETFTLIVDSIREIIDAVKPVRTFYTLETMPWIFPDSADAYLSLIKAIDRKAIAVHFDPVNLIISPRTFYHNGAMVKEFVQKLGPYIKSCHAKDIQLNGKFMVHLDEVMPGKGAFDYRTLLTELHHLNPDMPLIIEHLSTSGEYREAADYIRKTAKEVNIPL
jgi:sugar phosphate isomerase/epimerase